jgi:rubrerythrin
MELRKVYEYALQREHEGFNFFRDNAERMSHASAKGIFDRLAQEEQMHIEFIQGKLQELEGTPASPSADLPEGRFFLERAASELLEQTVVESMVPDLPILRMAYLIERDLAEFYDTMAGLTQGKAQEALKTLAEWERGHERLFKNLHDKILQEYLEMPWGG